jgi:CheY-like chemotaxis protein
MVNRLISSVYRSVQAGGPDGKIELPEKLLCCPSGQRESQSNLADRVQSSFAQKRILCVDDNVLELMLRDKILELQGYSVELLSCPIQA